LCGDVYDYPNTPFVATFVGENNPFYAKILSIENDVVKVETQGNTFLATAGKINEKQNHSFSNGDEVIMFIRPESIFIKNENNKFDNTFSAKVSTIEFEGNLKNIYLKINSSMNVRFSVPNAVDTSELSSNKEVQLTFSSQKAVVLPKGTLAVD
jgi:spermidine/putrescine transport system ATP-binding protein